MTLLSGTKPKPCRSLAGSAGPARHARVEMGSRSAIRRLK
jgi:hypothetical protein